MVAPQSQNVYKLPQKRISHVSSHQTVSRWFIFMFSAVRILYFDETSWLSTAYLSLCQDEIRGWNQFAFMWIVFTF